MCNYLLIEYLKRHVYILGSFLQHEFEGRVEVAPTLQIFTISKADATYFVDKQTSQSCGLLRNVTSHEQTQWNGLPGKGDNPVFSVN